MENVIQSNTPRLRIKKGRPSAARQIFNQGFSRTGESIGGRRSAAHQNKLKLTGSGRPSAARPSEHGVEAANLQQVFCKMSKAKHQHEDLRRRHIHTAVHINIHQHTANMSISCVLAECAMVRRYAPVKELIENRMRDGVYI